MCLQVLYTHEGAVTPRERARHRIKVWTSSLMVHRWDTALLEKVELNLVAPTIYTLHQGLSCMHTGAGTAQQHVRPHIGRNIL